MPYVIVFFASFDSRCATDVRRDQLAECVNWSYRLLYTQEQHECDHQSRRQILDGGLSIFYSNKPYLPPFNKQLTDHPRETGQACLKSYFPTNYLQCRYTTNAAPVRCALYRFNVNRPTYILPFRSYFHGPPGTRPSKIRRQLFIALVSIVYLGVLPIHKLIFVYTSFILTRSSRQWWSGRSTNAHDVLNLWSPICNPWICSA